MSELLLWPHSAILALACAFVSVWKGWNIFVVSALTALTTLVLMTVAGLLNGAGSGVLVGWLLALLPGSLFIIQCGLFYLLVRGLMRLEGRLTQIEKTRNAPDQ